MTFDTKQAHYRTFVSYGFNRVHRHQRKPDGTLEPSYQIGSSANPDETGFDLIERIAKPYAQQHGETI